MMLEEFYGSLGKLPFYSIFEYPKQHVSGARLFGVTCKALLENSRAGSYRTRFLHNQNFKTRKKARPILSTGDFLFGVKASHVVNIFLLTVFDL